MEMNLKDVRTSIQKEMSYIPRWINTTSAQHHLIWNYMLDINDLLMILVIDRFLSVKAIGKIMEKFYVMIEEVLSESDKLDLRIAVYYTAMLEYMTSICLDNELYEAVENIKKFSDLYFEKIETI